MHNVGFRPTVGVLILAVAMAAALSSSERSEAQTYPSRSVKIVVPFPAGGTADAIPRVIGDWLSRKWGHPVIIENRSGAGGNVGRGIRLQIRTGRLHPVVSSATSAGDQS